MDVHGNHARSGSRDGDRVMLHHFPVMDSDGRWHAAYMVPGTSTAASVVDCPTRAAAQLHADNHNQDQERKARISAAMAQAIEDRPIPKGFYTNADAL